MTVAVKIFFSGLMLLVAEEDPQGVRNEAMMLLADAMEHGGQQHIPHEALLSIPCTSLVDSQQRDCLDRRFPAGIRVSSECDDIPCIVLDQLDISILPDGAVGTESLKLYEGNKPEDARRHSDADGTDLGWIPDLRKILGLLERPSAVPGEFFKQSASLPARLVSRVRLTQGSLKVERFETEYGVWQFRTKNTYAIPYRQEVPERIEYESGVGNKVVVRIAKPDGTVLLDLDFRRDASLLLSNDATLKGFCKVFKKARLEHFSVFYRLIEGTDGVDLPLPESRERPKQSCHQELENLAPGKEGGGGLGPVICMSAQATINEEFPVWTWR